MNCQKVGTTFKMSSTKGLEDDRSESRVLGYHQEETGKEDVAFLPPTIK